MNKSSVSIISAVVIALGMAALGLFVKNGIDNLAFRDRQVVVKGLAEREVKADRVTWPIDYSVAGNNLLGLYDQVTNYNKIITKFLTSNGIDASEISVTPPSVYNAATNQYRSSGFEYQYSLQCTVSVTTSKVEKVLELLNRQSELLKEGVPFSNSFINYEYTSLNEIKPEMIAEATKNAREAAVKFAQDSDSKLGKMKTATQGQFTIEDSSSTPYLKKVRVVTTIVYYIED